MSILPVALEMAVRLRLLELGRMTPKDRQAALDAIDQHRCSRLTAEKPFGISVEASP